MIDLGTSAIFIPGDFTCVDLMMKYIEVGIESKAF
jgi:hypothetical protein